ncbi:MAG: ABC transporter permease [Bacillota bacterium]|jgi:peptide/nickel transport system permease protein
MDVRTDGITDVSASYGLRPVWRRFRRHRLAFWGLVVVSFFCLMAVFASQVAPHDPYRTFVRSDGSYAVWDPPSSAHLLGTDNVGRDVLSRLIFAGRVSMSVGIIAVAVSTVIGVILGSAAGFFGGPVDSVIMRFTDTVICFPVLFLVLIVATMVGPSIYNIMLVIGLIYWTRTCRLVRAEFLRLREMEFTEASRALGAGSLRTIFRHLLPNAISPVTVSATLLIAQAILIEASLSFLGAGVQQPVASWGNMLNEATSYTVLATRPWLWVPPGLAIMLTVLAVNFIGDGLREALDPRQKQ